MGVGGGRAVYENHKCEATVAGHEWQRGQDNKTLDLCMCVIKGVVSECTRCIVWAFLNEEASWFFSERHQPQPLRPPIHLFDLLLRVPPLATPSFTKDVHPCAQYKHDHLFSRFATLLLPFTGADKG